MISVKHFPSWFPGTYYATFARAAKPLYQKFLDIPVDRVQEQIVSASQILLCQFHEQS